MSVDFRALCREFVCDIVIFFYKTGDALLDASIRPFISTVVCRDMLDSLGEGNDNSTHPLSFGKEEHNVHLTDTGHWQSSPSNHSGVVCSQIDQLPSEISEEVQRQAAMLMVVYRLLSLPAALLGLFCGAWSDSRGRKLPMMVPSAGSCLAVLLYLQAVSGSGSGRTPGVPFLLAGAATQSVFGKTPLISLAVNSHVSDTSDVARRTRRLGRLLGSSFLGTFLGSFLAGLLPDLMGLARTLVIVSLCHALCVIVVVLGITDNAVPKDVVGKQSNGNTGYEDLEPSDETDNYSSREVEEEDERRRGGGERGRGGGGERRGGGGGEEGGGGRRVEDEEHGLFSWQGLRQSMMTVVRKREGGKRAVIVISLTALTFTQILKVGDQDVTVLFLQQPPLSWPAHFYGYLLAVDYGVMGVTLFFVLPVLSGPVLALTDTHIVLLAIAFKLVRALWAGFCTQTWMMFTSVACGALGGLINPGLRSILSKMADEGEVGKLFSIQASLETLSKLVGSGVFTGIYAATLHLFPPAAYLSEVLVYLLMAALLLWLGQHLKRERAHEWTATVPCKPYHAVSDVEQGSRRALCSLETTPVLTDREDSPPPVNRDSHEQGSSIEGSKS